MEEGKTFLGWENLVELGEENLKMKFNQWNTVIHGLWLGWVGLDGATVPGRQILGVS